jgi:hypothetical protein
LRNPTGDRPPREFAGASAFAACFNVFEAALAVVREKDLAPSPAHLMALDAAAWLDGEISHCAASQAIAHAIAARERFSPRKRDQC